jgi:hypothetical protein
MTFSQLRAGIEREARVSSTSRVSHYVSSREQVCEYVEYDFINCERIVELEKMQNLLKNF